MNVLRIAVTCLFISLVASCANDVTEKRKTTNRAFDGAWHGNVSKAAGTQMKSNNWTFTCSEIKFNVALQISDGVVNGYIVENKNISFSTFLNNKGYFYHAAPKPGSSYTPTGTDTELKENAKEFHVFKGKLNSVTGKGKGAYTRASTNMDMQGCEADITFTQD